MPGAPLSLTEREMIVLALIEGPGFGYVVIRRRVGRREADRVIGVRNSSGVLWLKERVTRYSSPATTPT